MFIIIKFLSLSLIMSQGSIPQQQLPQLPISNFDLLESWLEPMSAAQVHSLLVDIACAIPEAFERIRDRVKVFLFVY